MDFDLSYENGGMHSILNVTHMSGNICKMSKYIGSDSTIMQNHINHCLKLKDNTLFYMPDRFLEAFVKFQIY